MVQKKWTIWLYLKSGCTDCKSVSPEGEVIRTTLEISESSEMPIIAARKITACGPNDEPPIVDMKLILKRENKIAADETDLPLILIISKGHNFRYQEKVEYGNRAAIVVLELDEKIDREGNIVTEMKESEINKVLRKIYQIPSAEIIISLTNSMENNNHEKNLLNVLNTAGYSRVYVSHEPHKLLTIIPRMDSTLFDTFLAPTMSSYLEIIAQKLGNDSTIELIIE